MTHQVFGLTLIVVFTVLGALSYPHVRRLCAGQPEQAE